MLTTFPRQNYNMPNPSGKVMPMRIKIPIPSKEPLFQTTQEVRVGDLNYGNHLGNDRLLLVAHEARMKFLNSLGFSELSFFGTSLIMTDAAIQYQAQAFWGDALTIKLWLEPVNDMRFDLYYLLTKNEDQKVASIKTGLAFFDYDTQRVVKGSREYLTYLRELNDLS